MNEPQVPDGQEPLLRLLGTVGRRLEPPVETRDAVYLSTRLAWQRELQRGRRTRLGWLAAASVAALAVALVWTSVRDPSAAGRALVAQARGGGLELRVGDAYGTGADQGIVLETATGDRLRLDRDSRVRGVDATTLGLERGRLYFESGAAAAAAVEDPSMARRDAKRFAVVTVFGTVIHVGTRFAVEVQPDRLAVQVRDGRVRIETDARRIDVDSGVRVAVDAAGRELERRPAARHGATWAWVDSLAPPLALDGRALIDVLEDIAGESGRRLEFADDGVRLECRTIELKGPFIELPMGHRLFAVLATTGLEAIEDGERIVIRHRSRAATPAPTTTPAESG